MFDSYIDSRKRQISISGLLFSIFKMELNILTKKFVKIGGIAIFTVTQI